MGPSWSDPAVRRWLVERLPLLPLVTSFGAEAPAAAYGNSAGQPPLDGVSARAWTPVPGSAAAEAYVEAAGYSAP
ncbi:hypothetical protein GCM10010300_18370 [Streptomyces olivaceoviridis]|nr:hypothetical protein GCM10010300_18370 [Streptomyces olivaceoviridis]